MAASTRARSSLRQRFLLALLGYVMLLSIAVAGHGFIVNEHAEQLVWQSLLESELDHVLERTREDPNYRWVNTHSMTLYDGREAATLPRALRGLGPGIHDDLQVG